MFDNSQTAAEIAHSYDVAAEYVPVKDRINPTPEQIAVRDALAEVGNLDTHDATRMIVARLDDVTARMAAGETAESIACDITLRSLNGVKDEQMELVVTHLRTKGDDYAKAVRDFHYLDLEDLLKGAN